MWTDKQTDIIKLCKLYSVVSRGVVLLWVYLGVSSIVRVMGQE